MAPTKPSAEGRPKVPPKKIIDTIREATGASDEDIKSVLAECNNDVNEATARLIDNPFSKVVSKKDRRKEREVQLKKEKAAEAKRNYSNRGGRGGAKVGGRGGGRGSGPRRASDAQVPKPVQKKEAVAPAPERATVETQENGIEPAPIPQVTRTGGTMADLFKKPAPVPEKKQPRPAPQSQRPANGHAPPADQGRAESQPAGAWSKAAEVQQQEAPRPQPPSAPPTGLATSLMSALGAGNPPKSAQNSLPQQTQPSAGQGQLAESEQRGQPGSTSADDVGLNLQFGNFGLGTGNEFGAGFGSTFESQPAQGGAQAQNTSRYNEQSGGGQGKQPQAAFPSFQQTQGDVSVQRTQNTDSQQQQQQQMQQQQMQHMQQAQYGYSASYGQTAAYWPQQQAPRQQQAPPSQQQQQQQGAKPGKTEAPAPPPQQQQATMMAYGAPGMGAAMAGQYATQYPGYQYPYQYAQYPGYYPPQYYAPPQGSQYPPQPPSATQGARAAGGNNFGAGLYDQQDVNYQQPPASGSYQGQPGYNYGQYGR